MPRDVFQTCYLLLHHHPLKTTGKNVMNNCQMGDMYINIAIMTRDRKYIMEFPNG